MNEENRLNIFFKVKGGAKVGLGHVTRSLELAKEFDASFNVAFFSNDDPNVMRRISEERYKVFFSSNRSQDKEIAELVHVTDTEKVNILIIDQPDTCKKLCATLKKECPSIFLVGLDYFDYKSYVDVIVNLFNQNPRSTPGKDIRYYEGVQYAIVREAFEKYAIMDKNIKKEVSEVIITFGGADPSQNTVEILELLNRIEDEPFKVNVVVGPAFHEKDKIIDVAKNSKHECSVRENVYNFEELVFRADLGFIGAGTTLMEFCAVGTPAIVSPQNEQEKRFARYMEKTGAIRSVDKRLAESEITDMIQGVINDVNVRKRMSETQKRLVDTDGKRRIKEIVVSNYNKRFLRSD